MGYTTFLFTPWKLVPTSDPTKAQFRQHRCARCWSLRCDFGPFEFLSDAFGPFVGAGGGESSPQDLGCLWFFVVPKSFVMIEWSLYIWTLIICGEEIWGRGSSILWILPPGKIHIWNEVWFKWSSFSIGWCLGSMLTSSGIFHAPKNLTFPQILGCYSVITMCSGLKTLHFDGFGVLIQTLNVWNVWLL